MARTIKIHQMGRSGMEIKEVGLSEAKLILEDAATWGWLIADAKTQEVIWEIGPEVEEIMIIGMCFTSQPGNLHSFDFS